MNSVRSEKNSQSADGDRWSSTAGAFLGAIFIHPGAFAIAWLKGIVLGASVPMAPTPTYREGYEGGLAGIEELLFIYAITLGLVPLLISLVGAGCGFALARRFGTTSAKSEPSSTPQAGSTSPGQVTAMWASSLFIGQASVQYLIFLALDTPLPSNVGAILIGLHLCIWGLGAAVAFMTHHDLRVVAGLVGIAVLLPILGPFLPRFVLLSASIGVLLFCIGHRLYTPPR